MSRHHPVFRPLEDYKPGQHCGLFSNLHKHSNRSKVIGAAKRALGCGEQQAGGLAFITWLVELGYLTDDPSVPPVRVQQMRPHGQSSYWTLGEGAVGFRVMNLGGGGGFKRLFCKTCPECLAPVCPFCGDEGKCTHMLAQHSAHSAGAWNLSPFRVGRAIDDHDGPRLSLDHPDELALLDELLAEVTAQVIKVSHVEEKCCTLHKAGFSYYTAEPAEVRETLEEGLQGRAIVRR